MAEAVGEGAWVSTRTTVLTASTGAIGVRLPVERIAAAVPALVAALGDDVVPAAEAIRTTDLRTKLAFREIDVGGKAVRFAAIAKGSGMIHPQMATMLCFITTDATRRAGRRCRRRWPTPSRRRSTPSPSTATCRPTTRVIALANGALGRARRSSAGSADFDKLQATLVGLCGELARAIAADGEGATKLLVVDVAGRARARRGARSGPRRRRRQPGQVRHLRRRSVVGPDPGRARRARRRPRPAARSGGGHARHPGRARLREAAAPVAFDKARCCRRACRRPEIAVRLDLGAGQGVGARARLRPHASTT